jgi:hypothetical protein
MTFSLLAAKYFNTPTVDIVSLGPPPLLLSLMAVRLTPWLPLINNDK